MKNVILKTGAWISTLPILILPAAALAQLSNAVTQLESVGGAIGTADTTNTLPVLVGKMIALLLSVLGIIFVILIVYAGFLYLTDQGKGENVKKAKDILSKSITGLIIIIAAYAISKFIINALGDVT